MVQLLRNGSPLSWLVSSSSLNKRIMAWTERFYERMSDVATTGEKATDRADSSLQRGATISVTAISHERTISAPFRFGST
jgi:hypothetical protein